MSPATEVPNPVVEAKAFLDALNTAAKLPAGTTYGTAHPVSTLAAPYVQYAWDATPSYTSNRESTALRFTAWAPRGRATDAQDLAGKLLAWFFNDWPSANLWRVNRGPGRLPGTDPDTNLPFCSVTVYPQMKVPIPT